MQVGLSGSRRTVGQIKTPRMGYLKYSISKTAVCFLTFLATLLVGWLDYFTGAEVRVLALYFLPLLLAGWHLGKKGAAFSALFAVAVWLTALYADGVRFSSPYVWITNGLTEGAGFLVVSILVAMLRESLNRERSLSRKDQLTGLANRRSFFELVAFGLALCRRQGRPVSMVYIDLDNFKLANDNYGHATGDDLLRQCSKLIVGCVRSSDTVARLGGDEFAIFMPETDAASVSYLVERIRHAIESAPYVSSFAITASFGIASEDPVKSDVAGLLSQADAQMYLAKRRRMTTSNDGTKK